MPPVHSLPYLSRAHPMRSPISVSLGGKPGVTREELSPARAWAD